MRIFLIGYKGSGKTTTGNFLAEKLSLPFIDLDRYIEENLGRTIPVLYEEVGEERFRMIEKDNLIDLINKFDNCIIATGGGTPRYGNNMDILLNTGYVIYIKVNDETLINRWKKYFRERPIFKNVKSEDDLQEYLNKLRNANESIYSRAHYIFDFETQSLDDLLNHIDEVLKNSS